MSIDIWTEEEEKQLLALQKRRRQTFERNRDNLLALLKRYLSSHNGSTYSGYYSPRDVAMALIEHGGEFRDLLEPFDHMGRDKAAPGAE